MSARESLQRIRAHFAAHLDVAIADESPSQAKGAMELLDDVDVVLAALSTPPADDVREALAKMFFYAEAPHARWKAGHEGDGAEHLYQNAYSRADDALALVRPHGTVTPTVDEWSEQMDAERARQIEHGYDDAHDVKHGAAHLLNWAIDYARRGNNLAAATMARCALRLPRGTVTDAEDGESLTFQQYVDGT